jgi:hypothetical protein
MLGVARVAKDSPTKVAIFESGTDGHFVVQTVRSTNDGETWEPTRYTVVSSRSCRCAAGFACGEHAFGELWGG